MLTISSAIRRTETPDGAVLLDLERGEMFSLNPVGAKILDLVANGMAEREVVSEVSREFEVNVEIAHRDVSDFLQKLRERHILEADGQVEDEYERGGL